MCLYTTPIIVLAWRPAEWDSLEVKLEKLQEKTNISASNFIDDEHRPTRASLIDGLANVSNIGQYI